VMRHEGMCWIVADNLLTVDGFHLIQTRREPSSARPGGVLQGG
jgi:beta-lactam-binding protein with PASTA domain